MSAESIGLVGGTLLWAGGIPFVIGLVMLIATSEEGFLPSEHAGWFFGGWALYGLVVTIMGIFALFLGVH